MSGKKIIFLGSSVTLGDNGWSMCEYLEENTDYKIIKSAVNGTTLVDMSEQSYVSRLNALVKSENVCDCLVCQLSTNDSARKMPLGKISPSNVLTDFDTATIIGAIEYIVALAKEKWNCEVFFYTGIYMDSPIYQTMVDSLIELSHKWDFKIIDLWNNNEFRQVSEEDYKIYMKDPIHPTRLGYSRWVGPEFKKALSNL